MNDTAKRFRVAFSFAGEKRNFVAQVAAIIAARFSKAEILYDKYHEAEFACRDLGFYLPNLYYDQSDLVIVVVCRDYQQKEWCGLEWHAIFALLQKRKDSEVMLCRFDHAMVSGLFDIAGFVELDDKTPDQAATLVLERLALNEGKPRDFYHSNLSPVTENRGVHLKTKLDSLERTSAEGKSTIATQPNTVTSTAIGPTEVSIGIITALPKEFVAMKAALFACQEYHVPGQGAGRRYILGSISSIHAGYHRIALALADVGNNIASARADLLLEHFNSVEAIIMVGIAGGVPSTRKPEDHVRLGDVVVSNKKGVVQYDMVKLSEVRACLIPPSARLIEAVRLLEAGELEGKRPWDGHVDSILIQLKKKRPPQASDKLHDSRHPTKEISHPKDAKRLNKLPRVFFGPIASANELLKDPVKRDALRDRFGVKAVEMEGSGIADATWNLERGYLVVRGICDYCDSHKNDVWQEYAAAVAAGYTKALIESMHPREFKEEERKFISASGELRERPAREEREQQEHKPHVAPPGRVAVLDVFISCKNLDEHGVQTRDAEIAAEVYDFLTAKGLSVFLSTLTLEELGASDYTSAIDSALKSATVLLAIGTSPDHLESNWVKYEWNSFANAIRSGRKLNARIFTYIEGMPIADLPWGLQQTQTFVHGKGSLQSLYNFINKALSPPGSSRLVIRHGTQTHAGRPVAPSQGEKTTMRPPTRAQVFISYSHKDKRWCDELDTHLKPHLRAGSISSWSDKQIPPGSEWFEEIKSALTNTKVAVLLVTPNFIASDFIHEHELGPFLKMAEEGGVRILWVPVRASAYKRTPLKDYQAVLDTDKPLANMNGPERDKAWVKICEEIEKVVSNIPGRQQERAIREKAYGPRRSEAQEQPMPKDSKARVFVSHSSKDKRFARKLVEALREHNLNVWIDERELQVGDSIVGGISHGLKNADYLVAVLSKASMASRWVQAELNATLMEELSVKGGTVLPVLIEDCELPTLLKDRVYADFRHDFSAGLQKLLAVFEQEGESAADAAPEVTINAAPCFQKLSAITLADLRRRITKRMDRGEVSALWFAVLETPMENDMAGRQLSECVISLLDKAKSRNKLPLIIEEICQDRADLANP